MFLKLLDMILYLYTTTKLKHWNWALKKLIGFRTEKFFREQKNLDISNLWSFCTVISKYNMNTLIKFNNISIKCSSKNNVEGSDISVVLYFNKNWNTLKKISFKVKFIIFNVLNLLLYLATNFMIIYKYNLHFWHFIVSILFKI